MIDVLILSISSISCFLFPLLLTLKSLSRIHEDKGNDLSILANNLQFLVNYWVCYLVVMYLQDNIAFKLAAMFGVGGLVDIVFLAVKIWLFYGHGCLTVNYFYVRQLSEKVFGSQSNDFVRFEANFFEPFVRKALIDNYCINTVIALFQNLLGEKSIINNAMSKFSLFIDSIPKNQTFLQFSLLYICYIDSPEDLMINYHTSRRLLEDVISFNWLKNASNRKEYPANFKSFKILNHDDLSRIARSENRRDGYGSIYKRGEIPYIMDDGNKRRAVSINGSNTYTIDTDFFLQNKQKVIGSHEHPANHIENSKNPQYASPTRLRSSSDSTKYEFASDTGPPYPTDPSIENLIKKPLSPPNSNISNPVLDITSGGTSRKFKKITKKF